MDKKVLVFEEKRLISYKNLKGYRKIFA